MHWNRALDPPATGIMTTNQGDDEMQGRTPGRALLWAAIAAVVIGCARQAEPAEAAAARDGSAQDAGKPGTTAANPAQSGFAQGGAFAREPDFQLPVPVSNAPVRAQAIPESRRVLPDEVRLAVLEGLGEAGAAIQVQVAPNGIVSLSGEVDSIAQRQHVHYLTRALPGVVEVDYRDLRVRQR
jgi:hypothetical protein